MATLRYVGQYVCIVLFVQCSWNLLLKTFFDVAVFHQETEFIFVFNNFLFLLQLGFCTCEIVEINLASLLLIKLLNRTLCDHVDLVDSKLKAHLV